MLMFERVIHIMLVTNYFNRFINMHESYRFLIHRTSCIVSVSNALRARWLTHCTRYNGFQIIQIMKRDIICVYSNGFFLKENVYVL